ncbi:hypothetical protein ABT274_12315 [Streptomyces sp. NPDC001127]|uniref:hypothetical protein n=1 Tax=Streptomyces sp. NPDC001127 TaxID=3154377 RepID=UPI0033294CCE
MSDIHAIELWKRLVDALNDLDAAGQSVSFGDRLGPETDWRTAPYAYDATRPDSPRAAWDRKRHRWTVEYR